MLLKTHVATALLLAYIFDYHISYLHSVYASNIIARLFVYITSVILQYLIDQIGHTGIRHGDHVYPARNLYHSLPVVILIGAGVGIPYYLLLNVKELVYLFISVMLLHWLEDLVTEGGVYIWRKRVRLPRGMRIRYDSVRVNRLAILLLITVALIYTNPVTNTVEFMFFLLVATYVIYTFVMM